MQKAGNKPTFFTILDLKGKKNGFIFFKELI